MVVGSDGDPVKLLILARNATKPFEMLWSGSSCWWPLVDLCALSVTCICLIMSSRPALPSLESFMNSFTCSSDVMRWYVRSSIWRSLVRTRALSWSLLFIMAILSFLIMSFSFLMASISFLMMSYSLLMTLFASPMTSFCCLMTSFCCVCVSILPSYCSLSDLISCFRLFRIFLRLSGSASFSTWADDRSSADTNWNKDNSYWSTICESICTASHNGVRWRSDKIIHCIIWFVWYISCTLYAMHVICHAKCMIFAI